jgi:hypothetical protein
LEWYEDVFVLLRFSELLSPTECWLNTVLFVVEFIMFLSYGSISPHILQRRMFFHLDLIDGIEQVGRH